MRNEIFPDRHAFILQGDETLYFVQLPMFQMANHRRQLIFRAEIPSDALTAYRKAKTADPKAVFVMYTSDKVEFSKLVEEGGTLFHGDLYEGLPKDGEKSGSRG